MTGALQLVDRPDDRLELHYGDVELFRYVYRPQMAPEESPKPYFHPIRTLAGNVVTIYRPYDHVWHKGLQMTFAVLSGQNFWGGPTYVHGQGYVQLPNNGRMEHRAWKRLESGPQRLDLLEELTWISYEGEPWIAEERAITLDGLDAQRGYWSLGFRLHLTNVRPAPLVFGSPTTEGRPNAGYGGLFWRGPRSFFRGKIFAPEGQEGPGMMGRAAPWLAYTGRHDETADTSTLIFVDQPDSFRFPARWFVRDDPFAAASFAVTFDEEHTLPPGASIDLHHRIVIANGAWSAEDVGGLVAGS